MTRLKFNKLTNKLGHLLYPWSCQICHGGCGERAGICADCYMELPWCGICCVICGLPLHAKTASPMICGICQQQKPYFDRLFAPLWYQSPISEFIINFKYSNRWENVALLVELFLSACTKPSLEALLLSVPSHPQKTRARGFYPVHEFLRELRQRKGFTFRPNAITHTRIIEPQTGKTKKQRRLNVKDAFNVEHELCGKHIILFDDVVTTGATVNELSRCLKKQGAEYVEVWAIARTKRNIDE